MSTLTRKFLTNYFVKLDLFLKKCSKSSVQETSQGPEKPSSFNLDQIHLLKTSGSNTRGNITTRFVSGILVLSCDGYVVNFPLPSLIVLAIEDDEPVLKVTFRAANGHYGYLCPVEFPRSYPLNQPDDIYWLMFYFNLLHTFKSSFFLFSL